MIFPGVYFTVNILDVTCFILFCADILSLLTILTHTMLYFQGLVHCSDISNVPISAADIGKLYKMGQVTLFLGLKIINLVN